MYTKVQHNILFFDWLKGEFQTIKNWKVVGSEFENFENWTKSKIPFEITLTLKADPVIRKALWAMENMIANGRNAADLILLLITTK